LRRGAVIGRATYTGFLSKILNCCHPEEAEPTKDPFPIYIITGLEGDSYHRS